MSATTVLTNLGNLGTLAGVGLAAASYVQDQKAYSAINRKLDDLLKGQQQIMQGIDRVYAEVKENDLKVTLLEYENAINKWYLDYCSLVERAREPDEDADLLMAATEEL